MQKIIIHFLFVASCLSWVLFFILSFIFFSPNQTLQVFNNYLPSSYDLQYSEVVNNGSFLNPILEFSNISIQMNDAQVFSAKKSHYGFLISDKDGVIRRDRELNITCRKGTPHEMYIFFGNISLVEYLMNNFITIKNMIKYT